MKKYFIADTDEEIKIGDVVQVGLENKSKFGVHRFESDITVSEKEIPFLLDMGVIEEREEDEDDNNPENDLLDFGDETPCEALEALEEDFEALEERVESLEQEIRQLKGMHMDYVALKEFVLGRPEKEEKKNAQPKKK